MGETSDSVFSPQVIDEWAGLGIDLPALFSAGELGNRVGLRIQQAAPERVVGTLPVAGNTQPYGLLHGGASAVLAETLGSVGAMLHAGPGKIAVGVDLNCTHHRPVRTGVVTGVATPAHVGRTSATFEVVITDERGKRVCTARLTSALRPAAQQNAPAADASTSADAGADAGADADADDSGGIRA
ncbi:hotdog fold thioesterase [Streptomyces sp. 3MP-14]|uniref:Hotdog fold thioesterase n=1 Tax=Streptomyces mimosae TaxID=2586635 RepID=A0A5N6AL18_9ACTN|nr:MULTISPECIES: hotdog fold thioesterase [Streptomyces]KAB8168756.1 hotdog fold thioesterase [Streptomyces mimosae]KAB8177964.1 hotdog fold thioesterase [Streptomyces sp. 3MP-14]